MKKIKILLLLLLVTQLGFSQQNYTNYYVDLGLNPSVLLNKETKGELNWFAKLGHNFDSKNSVAVFYERYNADNYVSYGVQPSTTINIVAGLQVGLGLEASIIERYDVGKTVLYGGTREHYLTGAINGSLAYKFDKHFTAYYGLDYKYRPDIADERWVLSPSIGLRFGFL